mmetsp:Transcript_16929/g.43489  ORF Transcript_16929/g.43489 Transcript_16929/m.43489 type:complete len:209 (-) Transcript_16929:433-1059(-)
MAQIGRLVRTSHEEADAKDLELSARARMKAEEKERMKAADEAKKLAAEMQADVGKPSWGKGGVHSLVDEDYAVYDEDSPLARRPKPGDTTPMAYPANETKKAPKKASPLGTGTGWAPAGMESLSSDPKDVIKRALEGVNAPVTPLYGATNSGSAVEGALRLLGEALTFERQRSVAAEERANRLEAQLAHVTNQLLETQAKAIGRLEAK